ncbi:MAG: ComEC/Rec2 family competence protein [Elusimicrobiota bacterium]|nr:ComEC/Rec2 family competence protein [Elusimicrobiota bacterium]
MLLPAAAVISGIIAGNYFLLPVDIKLLFGAGTLLSGGAAFFLFNEKRKVCYIFFLTGIIVFSSVNYIYKTTPGPMDISRIVPFTGTVRGKTALAVRNIIVKAEEVDIENDALQATGKIMVYPKEGAVKPPPGTYVEIKGNFLPPGRKNNPASLDMENYLKSMGAFTVVYAKEIKVLNKGKGIYALIAAARDYIARTTGRYMSGEAGGILKGMLLGLPGVVQSETLDSFRYAGITHIMAVSGLHVGLVMYIFYVIFSVLRIKENYSYLFSVFAMAVYILIAGARPSAIRAGLMFTLVFAGKLSGGRGNLYNNLFFAAMVLLLINPGLLYSPGFQLSFLAVWGIIYLAPVFSKYLWMPFSVSLAAVAAIVPVVTWTFYYLPLLAPVTNLIVVPLAGIAVSLGFIFLITALFSEFLAEIYAVSAGYAVKGIEYTVGFVKNYSIGGIYTGRPTFLFIGGFYIFLTSFGVKNKRIARILAFSGAGLCLIAVSVNTMKDDSFIAAIWGRKSCSYIVRPADSEVIIFTGKEDINSRAASNFLYSKGITRVRDIYVVHPTFVKLEGLADIANTFKTENIYYSGFTGSPLQWENFKESLNQAVIFRVWHRDIIKYSNFNVNIIEPQHKYIDIRDNFIQAAINGPRTEHGTSFGRTEHGTSFGRTEHGTSFGRTEHGTSFGRTEHGTSFGRTEHGTSFGRNIFIYAGGDIPSGNFDYSISIEPYAAGWNKLKSVTSKKIIASAGEEPPEYVELVKNIGKVYILP